MDISGILLGASNDATGETTESAEKQLWTKLLPLCRDTMGSKDSDDNQLLATLTWQLGDNGTVVCTGWIRNFNADRDAPEGLVEIKITFNFLFDTAPDTSGLS